MTRRILHRLISASNSSLSGLCIVCGLTAHRDFSICTDCEGALPELGICCHRCGIELGGRLSQQSCCPRCLLQQPSFDSCTAAFPYVSPISNLIADFKFSARFDIGYSLSRVLAQRFNAYYQTGDKPEVLLPVPLHSSRLNSRGFNQANEICKVLSRHCRVPGCNRALTKVRNTEPQTSMSSARARKANLHKAFNLSRPDRLAGVTHIALVDDVVTTMTTIETISSMLREHQDCRIDAWCLARASRL